MRTPLTVPTHSSEQTLLGRSARRYLLLLLVLHFILHPDATRSSTIARGEGQTQGRPGGLKVSPEREQALGGRSPLRRVVHSTRVLSGAGESGTGGDRGGEGRNVVCSVGG